NAASNTETATGSFTVSASDGIKELVVGGTTLSLADLKTLSTLSPSSAINTGEGTLKITSYSSTDSDQNATVSYTYTLNGAQTHNQLTANTSINDGVSITVNGAGGSTASDTLTIQINDDVPTAVNDGTKALTEDGTLTVSGNVLTNDSYGADGVNTTATTAFSWDANTAAKTELAKYGTLTLDANGNYSFTLNNTSTAVQGLQSTDVKTQELSYTITDADGDTSTQHVTITITGANDSASVTVANDVLANAPDSTVYEAGLP
ncbi:VCBS domain-containing protein, partial [Polynucleobacter alcilacus]|uniref:VCBS domain-containing protein n=1 Tax=Polynucleobacter alcilacus TaxID=1819739 RepID=UPI001C0DC275